MSKIPTAEEFFKQTQEKQYIWTDYDSDSVAANNIQQFAIDFAKLQVQEAQKAWFDKIKSEGLVTEAGIAYLENAYPLNLIK